MRNTSLDLLRSRRFLPLFVTQFLGALNDNVFKNALVILVLFRLAGEEAGQVLVTVAAGIFILPFFLFSATAGQIADSREKSRLIRLIKVMEIVIMVAGAGALYLGNVTVLLGVLFLMGTQSAFFGPLKYGILPDHLREDELVAGNGLIEAATYIAILGGTIAGGLLILRDGGLAMVSATVLVLALLGWLTSRAIPRAEPTPPPPGEEIRVNVNFLAETGRIVRHSAAKPFMFRAILGISWFWLIGATFLSQFPNLAKVILGGNEEVVTLFLTAFAVGIGIGSIACNAILKGKISTRWVPWAMGAITLLILDLYVVTAGRTAETATLGAAAFMAQPGSWRILFDLVGIAIAGGLFSVPLYAVVQHESNPEHRARNIAAVNILNSLFMVVGALWATGMLMADFTIPQILLSVGLLNAPIAAYAWWRLPRV